MEITKHFLTQKFRILNCSSFGNIKVTTTNTSLGFFFGITSPNSFTCNWRKNSKSKGYIHKDWNHYTKRPRAKLYRGIYSVSRFRTVSMRGREMCGKQYWWRKHISFIDCCPPIYFENHTDCFGFYKDDVCHLFRIIEVSFLMLRFLSSNFTSTFLLVCA